jgi:hypothetical protein
MNHKLFFKKSVRWDGGLDKLKKAGRLVSTMKNKSYKPEVLVDGQWSTNGLRFATAEEAFGSMMLTRMRWWVPTDGRATESEDPVNYRFINNQNVPIEA